MHTLADWTCHLIGRPCQVPWKGHRRKVVMTHFDRLDVVPLLGAMWSGGMVRCHCWGGVSAHVGGLAVPSDRLPLLGAMVRCHC